MDPTVCSFSPARHGRINLLVMLFVDNYMNMVLISLLCCSVVLDLERN
ncbi:hypothetical protein RchiOBHm_Chr7g0221751 [Rosa chinensis]|uniref:Uncharacterized protein n=1 Tax=Rosa chinensis TaxID=74649 RepID=A0A2P6PD37_ROSCH|nr:hypothetical protein RchiOBHm_Chr7g0221751 [Rosa chinensis]